MRQAKLHNWGYIETHGASGLCKEKETGKLVNGSPVIVHSSFPIVPINLCEIIPSRRETLETQFKGVENVKVLQGDCNKLIDKLHCMPNCAWYFHFLDPDGIRTEEKEPCDQLTYQTIKKVMTWRNSEVFLNFPLLAFLRWGSYSIRYPEESSSQKLHAAFTRFYGGEDWIDFYVRDSRGWKMDALVDNFISQRIQPYYKEPVLRYLVRTEGNSPVYYLIFGTNHWLGSLFMGKAFKLASDIWSKELSREPEQISLENFTKGTAIQR